MALLERQMKNRNFRVSLICFIAFVRSEDSTNDIFRVSKGLGAHGYGSLRASVVSNLNLTATDDDFYTYNAQFRYRWEQFRLQSGLAANLTSGTHQFSVGESMATVTLPEENAGVRGVWFGDPCTEPGFVGCIHFPNDTMANRMPRLVNALSTDTDYRVIIGDNFYDLDGSITSRFYRSLTAQAQGLIEVTVPGNHDYWYAGSPLLRDRLDPFGDGFVQWYAQDALAGLNDPSNFLNLTIDPDAELTHKHSDIYDSSDHPVRVNDIAAASNFLSYHKIGNVGFLGFSGAYSWEAQEDGFLDACSYFKTSPAAVIFVVGHWNEPGLGCVKGMHTPSVFARLSKMDGCNEGNLRYVAGHKHCNHVMQEDDEQQAIGYLLGGTGVLGSGCDEFGFGYLDSTSGRELMVGFSLADADSDVFEDAVSCFEKKGVGQCLEFGVVWRNSSLSV